MRGGTKDGETLRNMASSPTTESRMGDNEHSNAMGLQFCPPEHQSPIRMAEEEALRLADGPGNATNVQPT